LTGGNNWLGLVAWLVSASVGAGVVVDVVVVEVVVDAGVIEILIPKS
jgi:hypothetical protein